MNPPNKPIKPTKPVRWVLWGAFVTVWTIGLLVPDPSNNPDLFPASQFTLKFVIGKSVHLCAYAGMTILGGWLHLPARYRPLLMFFLMAHAGVTEQLQIQVAYRSGLLTDVLIDYLGVAIGLVFSWKWWTAD